MLSEITLKRTLAEEENGLKALFKLSPNLLVIENFKFRNFIDNECVLVPKVTQIQVYGNEEELQLIEVSANHCANVLKVLDLNT
jgi:hypothetical protein